MTKLESLHKIITKLSNGSGICAIEGICNAIQWDNNCVGIQCWECPFNSQENLNECAEEIENNENC